MLAELGFLWMSNRKIEFAEEKFRPGRAVWPSLRGLAGALGVLSDTTPLGLLALAVLNRQFLSRDDVFESRAKRLRWLLGERNPFERSGVVDSALSTPLDCDLLRFSRPTEMTTDNMLAYTTDWLIRGKSWRGDPYVLTFHDWIIGTGNRVNVLENVFGALGREGPMLDARSRLPQVGGVLV